MGVGLEEIGNTKDDSLIIMNHVIDRYRERVVEDSEREVRTERQIKYIIGEAFRHALIPEEGIYQEKHMLVAFSDPCNKRVLASYYLVVDINRIKGRLVAKTIKYCSKPPQPSIHSKKDNLRKQRTRKFRREAARNNLEDNFREEDFE